MYVCIYINIFMQYIIESHNFNDINNPMAILYSTENIENITSITLPTIDGYTLNLNDRVLV